MGIKVMNGKNPKCTYKFNIDDYVEVHVRKTEHSGASVWKFDKLGGTIVRFDSTMEIAPRPMYEVFFEELQNIAAFYEDELTLAGIVDIDSLLEMI